MQCMQMHQFTERLTQWFQAFLVWFKKAGRQVSLLMNIQQQLCFT